MTNTCPDCLYYLPVDVFQGICKISKEKINPEHPWCDKGEKIAKCKFCSHYSREKEHIGQCMQQYLAYPDMIANRCKDFTWMEKN